MGPLRSIAARFCRFARRSFHSPKTELNPSALLGRRGEDLAARHLRKSGYKILYRNFRAPHGGEVDIVCRDKREKTLVFLEVKTRSSLDYGSPSAAVDLKKQHLISHGAMAWLRMLDYPEVRFRFDIVEVLVEPGGISINIIRDAFQLPDPLVY